MQFNSIQYLVFFPVVTLAYYIAPKNWRWLWLLLCSYYFYMCWSAPYALLMLLSTVITYASGLGIDKIRKNGQIKGFTDKSIRRRMNSVVAMSFGSNLAILFFFKYFNFFNQLMERLLGSLSISWHAPQFNVLLPVGISFYTFQALSYTMDVYRQKISAQKHFGKYAVFVSFFPQLVAGPIERSENLLPQFDKVKSFRLEELSMGFTTILWGMFKKVVIADRVAVFVNSVYNTPYLHQGFTLIIATLFFAVQIYCDFSGYSDIAVGSARILGYNLMRNFDRPYFSKSIREFWRRWHISLSGWFKDYLYIPLGGNRVSKTRKHINTMIVFLASGLWHGANLTFVIWGGIHGLYQVVGEILHPLREKLKKWLRVDKKPFSYRFGQALLTFVLVAFAWIFFRANTWQDALYIIKNLFVFNYWVLADDSLFSLGLDIKEMVVALGAIAILFAIDWGGRKRSLNAVFQRQNILFRWVVLLFLAMGIIIFGSYGVGYDASAFIYFQF